MTANQSTPSRRVQLPRKGRIRIVLVIVAGLVAWRVYEGRAGVETGGENPVDSTAVVETAAPDKPETPKPQAPAPAPGGDTVAAGDQLSFDDVARMLRANTPSLNAPTHRVGRGRTARVAHLSVDTMLQRYGRVLMRRYHPKYGAIAMLEASTGRVLSLVSYVNEGEPFLGRDLYCRSYFPAASVYKVVTAAGGMERGRLNPLSTMRHSGKNHTLYKDQLQSSLRHYRTVTMADAFAYSYNAVFGRIGIYVLGEAGLMEWSSRFGFEQTIPFELPADTCRVGAYDSAFGQAEVASGFNQQTSISPLFGALMAAGIAERGRIPRPFVVDSVTAGGERLYAAHPQVWKLAMREETAEHMVSLMRKVVRYGTARESFRYVKQSHRFRDLEYGGKTGSVDKDGVGRVDWFVGFVRGADEPESRVGIGVVTVHGPLWTVRSSYVAAEMLRAHIRALEARQREPAVADAGTGGGNG